MSSVDCLGPSPRTLFGEILEFLGFCIAALLIMILILVSKEVREDVRTLTEA